MRKLPVVPMLLLALSSFAQQGRVQSLHYRISASLDDSAHRLTAAARLSYANRSGDTLYYVWFHCWPNAFRNDRTDYSEQALQNGMTRFYFSYPASRGYINQLEFRVHERVVITEDHPVYQDMVKVILPEPLPPGDSIGIDIRFQLQLPENFSGFGYTGRHFELRNWYPEPAVYDTQGWHPMPFLAEGGGYHERAAYDAELTVPSGYVIAGPGDTAPSSAGRPAGTRTVHLKLDQANGFAWAADRRFHVKTDETFTLPSGKKLRLAVYFLRKDSVYMTGQLDSAKSWLQRLSGFLPDFPYTSLSIVQSRQRGEAVFSGICFIDPALTGYAKAGQLPRQLAAQWFEAAASMDGRGEPWLSRGLTDQALRRAGGLAPGSGKSLPWPLGPAPVRYSDPLAWLVSAEREGLSQSLYTRADSFSPDNYALVSRTRSGYLLDALRQKTGPGTYDKAVAGWLSDTASVHNGASFRSALEKASGKSLFAYFAQPERVPTSKDDLLPAFPSLPRLPLGKATGNTYPLLPAVGYNRYDGFQLGILIHNYRWPASRFQFLLSPVYAFETKTVNGIGRLEYAWHPNTAVRKITLGINGSRFSTNRSTDSTGAAIAESVLKIVPYLRVDLRSSSARSTLEKQLLLKSYLIDEKSFTGYRNSAADDLFHPNSLQKNFRYLNELAMEWAEHRVLYPYTVRMAFQQASDFYRLNLTAQYFLNYRAGGGLSVRFFAAKFGVWNQRQNLNLIRFEPKLLGVTGSEDYSYDTYFPGRTASYAFDKSPVYNGGLPAQQIYNRDGGLKLRLDPYDYIQGRSADWVTSLNFSTTLPAQFFPFRLPLRLFFDVGTYAEAWEAQAVTSRFLYTGGVQLSIFHEVLNVYAPLVYSSDFRNLLKQEGFGKRITFSIDMQAAARWLNKEGSYHADDH